MSFTLEAVIGSSAVIRTVTVDLPAATLIPLPQGIAMMPMTDEFFDAVAEEVDAARSLGFEKLPGGFAEKLSSWSATAPIGYAEADFFGGVGTQQAALWTDGALTFGPVSIDEDEPFPPDGSPISQLLRHLGVTRGGHHDEFDALGLGRHRHTEGWLP